MNRRKLTLFLGLFALTGMAFGQDFPVLDESTPAENVTGSAVRQRAPGLIINAARSAHQDRQGARLAAQRSGSVSDLAQEIPISAAGSGGGGLTDLVGDLLGGVTGLDLGGLLGGLGGGLGTTTPTPTNDGISGPAPTSNIPDNITPEAIALLEASGFDVNELFAQTRETPEDKQVQQDATPVEEPRFLVRWADSVLTQLFFALTTTLNSPLFVDFLVDSLTPDDVSTTDDGTASDNDGTDSSDGTPVDVDRDPDSIVLGNGFLPALA